MKRGNDIRAVIRGQIAAWVVTVILLLLLAFLLLKLQWDNGKTELAILIVYVISTFFGGWMTGRKVEKMKFLYGLASGALYFLLLLAVSAMSDAGLQSGLATGAAAFLLCAAGGMVGGMFA